MTTTSPRSVTSRRSLDTTIVRVVTAVIGLHVVDDNFLQPNPGTSAADHLLGGLVPLALLVGAAVAYPRLRPFARGVTAFLIGLFGIAVGLEGWRYTLLVGPSGDDFTGLVCGPAGVVLIALAAVTLWRGRRLDGSLPRRCGRRAVVGVAAVAVGFFIVTPVLMGYQFTHLARPQVPEARLGSAYEEVRFETSDGLELEGWYVPSRNGAAVIAFPGRKGPQSRARFLARHGYGVLLFDRRGEGESDGDPNSYGWDGDRDVKAAIAYLQSRSDVDPTASAASGSRSAARCCWRRPPRPPRCGRSCPREQGTAPTARCGTSREPSRSRTSRWPWRSRSTPATRRRPPWATWSRRSGSPPC